MAPRCALVFALAAILLAVPASAGARAMVVGVDDDTVKWNADTPGIVRAQRDAGFGATKVWFPWRPGMWHPGQTEHHYLERLARMSLLRQRVVLAVSGRGAHPPRTAALRNQFCSYTRELMGWLPTVRDVVIWNEVNSPSFWRPRSSAPREYEALLARCWDVLHALRSDVNVISSTAPRYNPLGFIRRVGEAYRASGRTRPLVDTFGHNPYPRYPSEPPYAVHTDGYVGQGDYPALVKQLYRSFTGTPQPVASIWYLEDGFQTRPLGSLRYVGRENVLDPLHPQEQGDQLRTALMLAYCSQPLVGAFFNFQLVDEQRLGGWQSGVYWVNWTPKPAYEPVREVAYAIAYGTLGCA